MTLYMMDWNTYRARAEAARKLGLRKEEISEALCVAVTINAGGSVVYSAPALDAFCAALEASAA